MLVTIVIPTLNEETAMPPLLRALSLVRGQFEIVVADGGSVDRTVEVANVTGPVRVLRSERGRGKQQAAGASVALGQVLWFLHADSLPPPDAVESIEACLREAGVAGGNFRLGFDGGGRSARQLTLIYPWLKLLGLCYGDSGIFVRRSVYEAAGGFQPYALFEDLDLVRRIKKLGKFRTVDCRLVSSSRRFEHRNFAAVFARWTLLQSLYWAGIHPDRLARMYPDVRASEKSLLKR